MSAPDCEAPQFPWNAEFRWYEACTSCGRLAWDHAGCDPQADVMAHFDWLLSGSDGQPPGPTIRGTR